MTSQKIKMFFILTVIILYTSSFGEAKVINIGGELSSEDIGKSFFKRVSDINKSDILHQHDITLNATFVKMDNNPIQAAKSVCDHLIPTKVNVIIASHAEDNPLSPVAISFTSGYYKIPVIGISVRDSAFSDKNIHGSFMRTVAPYSQQTRVWADMLEKWKFKSVLIIHSANAEGRAMLGSFQGAADNRKIEISMTIQYTSGESNYTELLKDIPLDKSRVILLYAIKEDAQVIYRNAEALGLTEIGYAWIVTEQALRPSNTPIGIIGLKQIYSDDEEKHLHDAIEVIAHAFVDLAEEGLLGNITAVPQKCDEETKEWEYGDLVLKKLKEQVLIAGQTGHVAFDKDGDRSHIKYQVINQQHRRQVQVGYYDENSAKRLNIGDKYPIYWPNRNEGTQEKPIGIKRQLNLKVVTIEAIPFIHTAPVGEGGRCNVEEKRVNCYKKNLTQDTQEDFCCYGYCIDLLMELGRNVNFTFDVHLVEDGQYGSLEHRNDSEKKTWNGMIGEILTGKSDLIVAPLTVNPERSEYIDFSKPFKYQGLTVLVKKREKDSSLTSFLQPFHQTLWILVGLSVHVVALVLYLLDRFSPFGRYKLAKSEDTEEDALNLSGAVWFAWGVLLNSGIGEGTPRSFSARVLGMVWAGFAMIIVASYTANLAAFLVLDRPEAAISGIDDARLRNPQENFQFATVRGSAVSNYFKRQVELNTMYRTMEPINSPDAEDGIKRVKIDDLHAFIWDSSRLEYEAAKDCDLVTAGELFGRSGYGVGLEKDSPWTPIISQEILKLHENGKMEAMDSKWILVEDTKCPEKDPSAATLGLTNMAGVFMMVAGGIVMGVFLIFVEIAYKKHRGLKEKELELAKTAADRWRGNIEKKKTLEESWAFLREHKESVNRARRREATHPPQNSSAAASGTQPSDEWGQSGQNGCGCQRLG